MAGLPNNGLLPASFRGVPFVVTNDDIGGGRRQVVHQYPGRDDPWTEDMGRAARRFRFRGFIADGSIRFLGGPIQLQRALLIAALEKAGSGTLTHPTLGILNVSVTNFSIGQDLGAGRMSSVDVEFVESGKRSFPSILAASSGLLTAANSASVGGTIPERRSPLPIRPRTQHPRRCQRLRQPPLPRPLRPASRLRCLFPRCRGRSSPPRRLLSECRASAKTTMLEPR